MNIAFFVRHFLERGTDKLYDYAKYNETIKLKVKNKQKEINFPTERLS
jgi:hypothetical protein